MSIHGRWLFTICVATALPLGACKVYDPFYCDQEMECPDPDRPFCDLNGEYPDSEGVPRTCIADPDPEADAGPGADGDGGSGPFCAAGEFVQCTDEDSAIYCNEDGSQYVSLDCDSACDPERQGCSCDPNTTVCSDGETVHCGANGQVEEVESCALGCNDTGARCIDVEPSNGLGGYLDMTDEAPTVVLSNGAVIDTDDGTIEDGDGSLVDVPTFQITAPPGGVTIRVITVKSLTIGDATISGTRALAIVSDGDILVGGHVRILAGATDEGACVGQVGGRGGSGCGGLCQAIGGGGGGGFGQAGGDGGGATMDGNTGSAGAGGTDVGGFSLVPLHGGCSGGGQSTGLPIGGAGGGAIQLVSRTQIRVEDGSGEARLNAGGKAGTGSNEGGGSGGGILLEAPHVILASGAWRAVANGGGGSSVCGPPDPQDGTLTSMRALGGGQGCSNPTFGVGGNGGAGMGAATSGGDASSPKTTLVMGGGEGGGVGRIRVNVPARPDYMGETFTSPSTSVGTLATR